ncbi:MAG: uracil-DNA glycosylase family protein [Neisseria sp.]|nr:uracil-DNA glycosylase family protein [Neisseria sp.]
MLGSFPPPRAKWKMDFYYPNLQNDMWRIFGVVFFADKDYFLNEDGKGFNEALLRTFLQEKGIAISDAARQVRRLQGNASDKFLEVVTARDIAALLAEMPQCATVMTTGEKATEVLWQRLPENTPKPTIGHPVHVCMGGRTVGFYRLPSSSRAYPKPLAEKAAAYACFFRQIGLLA